MLQLNMDKDGQHNRFFLIQVRLKLTVTLFACLYQYTASIMLDGFRPNTHRIPFCRIVLLKGLMYTASLSQTVSAHDAR